MFNTIADAVTKLCYQLSIHISSYRCLSYLTSIEAHRNNRPVFMSVYESPFLYSRLSLQLRLPLSKMQPLLLFGRVRTFLHMFGHISIRSQQPSGSSKGCTFQLKCLRHHQMCSFSAIQPSISQCKIIRKSRESHYLTYVLPWLNMLNCGGMRNDVEVLWHIPWIPCEFFCLL